MVLIVWRRAALHNDINNGCTGVYNYYTLKKCEWHLNYLVLWQKEGNDDDDGHGGDNKKDSDE